MICPLEIKAQGATPAYVEVPGLLVWADTKPGSWVAAGARLAELENIDLELEIAQLTRQRDEQLAQVKSLSRLRFSDALALSQIPEAREALRSTEQQLAQRLADRKALSLVAPCDGCVLPPPEVRSPVPTESRLSGWSGTPFQPKNAGCFLETKTLFCEIGDPQKLEAVLVLDQADIELVKEAYAVEIKLDELSDEWFGGRILSIAQMEMRFTSPQLSTKSGGELATQTDRSGLERPQSTSYQAHVLLQDEGKLLRLGLGGRAKIHTPPRSVAERLWRHINSTFRFGA